MSITQREHLFEGGWMSLFKEAQYFVTLYLDATYVHVFLLNQLVCK